MHWHSIVSTVVLPTYLNSQSSERLWRNARDSPKQLGGARQVGSMGHGD